MNLNAKAPQPLLEINRLERIRQRLEMIYCDLLGAKSIDRDCGFLEAGGTSMDVLHLQFGIQEQFDVELKFGTIYQFSTVNLLALVIQESIGKAVAPELFLLRKCEFPQSAIAFIDTKGLDFLECLEASKHFENGLEVVYLEWKAWNSEHWMRQQIDCFAEEYAHLLLLRYPETPIILAASCDGAVVALEVARRMRAIREEVELVIIDTRGHCPERLTASYYWKRFGNFLASPKSDQWKKMKRHLRVLFSQLQQSSIQGAKNAKPKGAVSWLGGIRLEPIEGRVHLIRGRQSHIHNASDDSLGWRQLTLGKFELLWMEGTHPSMWTYPNAVELVALLQGIGHRS